MKRTAMLCLLISLFAGFRLHAQLKEANISTRDEAAYDTTSLDSFAAIQGILKDEKGNPIVSAYVECSSGGVVQGREITDIDGNYIIRPLAPGKVILTFKYQGRELIITHVPLMAGRKRILDATLVIHRSNVETVLTCACRRNPRFEPPLIDPRAPGGRNVHYGTMLW